jgi:hypothetical protein
MDPSKRLNEYDKKSVKSVMYLSARSVGNGCSLRRRPLRRCVKRLFYMLLEKVSTNFLIRFSTAACPSFENSFTTRFATMALRARQ